MPGAVIGKVMNLGYVGKVSRDGDALIVNRVVSSDSKAIEFGAPVFLNSDNTVRAMASTDTTADMFAGFAVATVIQATDYTQQVSSYQPAKGCDFIVRGSIIAKLAETYTTAPTAGATVYLTADGEVTADATGNIALPARFSTGYLDGKGGIEITVLERNLI